MNQRYVELFGFLQRSGKTGDDLSDLLYQNTDARTGLLYAPVFCPPLV
jgi:hypothetical protein